MSESRLARIGRDQLSTWLPALMMMRPVSSPVSSSSSALKGETFLSFEIRPFLPALVSLSTCS